MNIQEKIQKLLSDCENSDIKISTLAMRAKGIAISIQDNDVVTILDKELQGYKANDPNLPYYRKLKIFEWILKKRKGTKRYDKQQYQDFLDNCKTATERDIALGHFTAVLDSDGLPTGMYDFIPLDFIEPHFATGSTTQTSHEIQILSNIFDIEQTYELELREINDVKHSPVYTAMGLQQCGLSLINSPIKSDNLLRYAPNAMLQLVNNIRNEIHNWALTRQQQMSTQETIQESNKEKASKNSAISKKDIQTWKLHVAMLIKPEQALQKRRLSLWLEKLEGATIKTLATKYKTNVTRDCSNAILEARKLKELYPNLPSLPGMS